GTSTDEVAAAMEGRLRGAVAQANAMTADSIDDLLRRGAGAEARRAASDIVIRNDAFRSRGGVAIVDVVEKIADEPVGPGSGGGPRIEDLVAAAPTGAKLPPEMPARVTPLRRDRRGPPRQHPDSA